MTAPACPRCTALEQMLDVAVADIEALRERAATRTEQRNRLRVALAGAAERVERQREAIEHLVERIPEGG